MESAVRLSIDTPATVAVVLTCFIMSSKVRRREVATGCEMSTVRKISEGVTEDEGEGGGFDDEEENNEEVDDEDEVGTSEEDEPEIAM